MYKDKAVDYFDRHPSSNECHITSDGRVFHTLGTAQGFAGSLKDNKVESFTRAQIEVEAIPVVGSEELTGDATGAVGDQNEFIEQLKAFDFEKVDYQVAKKLVANLGLEPKTQKQPDLVEALKEALAKVNTPA